VIPGHGEAFTYTAEIDHFAACLRDVCTAVSELKKQGVSAEEAAACSGSTRSSTALRDSSALVGRQRSTHESRPSTGKRPVPSAPSSGCPVL
jgi:hypothetical protein